MTIDELLRAAQRCLVKLGEEDADDFAACNAWAIASQAYATTAQAIILAQMTDTFKRPDMSDRRVLCVDTGN